MKRSRAAPASGLYDDVLHWWPRAGSIRAWVRDGVDRLAGADPGLTQLRTALLAVLGVAVSLGLVYLFVAVTGALQPPAGSAPTSVLSAEDRAMLVLAMLLAGMLAMQAAMNVNERTVAEQLLFSLMLPVPMVATLVLGILVGPYSVGSLAFLVGAMTLAMYIRRFGQRGSAVGTAVFFGAFLGFLLSRQLGPSDAIWIAALLEIGMLASLLVRLGLLREAPDGTLVRMRWSQRARARRLLALGVRVLIEDDQRRIPVIAEQIRRQLVRLNETTLMIDAQLADVRPRTAPVESERSFQAELALSNCARFAVALAVKGEPADRRGPAAAALTAMLADDPATVSCAIAALRAALCDESDSVAASRLAAAIEQYRQARERIGQPVTESEIAAAASGDFTPAVKLVRGWLPGATPVSSEASTTPGRGLLDRVTIPSYLRVTIQIAVAGTLAVVAGNAVSEQRVYWAALTVFLCFLMASPGEQLDRALFRLAGTAIGIALGDLFVHLTGGRILISVLIVLVSLFFGTYLIRINYMFMTITITVVIAQSYAQLGEFSWQVLLLRLAETAVGFGAVVITVLFIIPLRPQRVVTTAVLIWFRALRALLDGVLDHLDEKREPLRPLVRAVDASYAALVAAAMSLQRVPFGRTSSRLTEILVISSAALQYARSLAAQVEEAEATGVELSGAHDPAVRVAAQQLRTSLASIENSLSTGEQGSYARSSSLFVPAPDDLRQPPSLQVNALQDLSLLDAALARLAATLQMVVADD